MRKVLLIFFSAAAGLLVTQPHTPVVDARAQTAAIESRKLERLVEAFERLRANYVDEIDESELITTAIKAMVGVLDNSEYLDAKTLRDLQITGQRQAGLGIEATIEKGLVKVIAPIDESPAAKAGIRPNDIITHIDDVPLEGLTLGQALDKALGPVNTRTRLRIIRKGQDKPAELTVVRDFIRIRSVRSRQEGEDIGHIRIGYFNEQTAQLLRQTISSLSSQIPADKLKGYVLDLRNNSGGLLDQAVSAADAFLQEGEIVSVRGHNPEQIERFSAGPGDLIDGKPLIVLINGGSASTAEIVAGALQDHKRATVIGTRSFGKGSVTTIVPLGPGNGVFRLTTARYFTPAGRSIQAAGILPDIEVDQDVPENPENDKTLKMAYDLLRGIAFNAAFPPNQRAPGAPH